MLDVYRSQKTRHVGHFAPSTSHVVRMAGTLLAVLLLLRSISISGSDIGLPKGQSHVQKFVRIQCTISIHNRNSKRFVPIAAFRTSRVINTKAHTRNRFLYDPKTRRLSAQEANQRNLLRRRRVLLQLEVTTTDQRPRRTNRTRPYPCTPQEGGGLRPHLL